MAAAPRSTSPTTIATEESRSPGLLPWLLVAGSAGFFALSLLALLATPVLQSRLGGLLDGLAVADVPSSADLSRRLIDGLWLLHALQLGIAALTLWAAWELVRGRPWAHRFFVGNAWSGVGLAVLYPLALLGLWIAMVQAPLAGHPLPPELRVAQLVLAASSVAVVVFVGLPSLALVLLLRRSR